MVKGANSAPETALPTKLQTGLQFLTKDFLRFCMVDICQEGRSQRPAPENTQPLAPDRHAWKLRLGPRGQKAHRTGESAPVKLLAA